MVIRYRKGHPVDPSTLAPDATSEEVAAAKKKKQQDAATARLAEKWELVRVLIEHVLAEFKFDTAFARDPTLNLRRINLRKTFFEELPEWGKMLSVLDPTDPSTAEGVLRRAFEAISDRGINLLANLLTGDPTGRAVATALVRPLAMPNTDAVRSTEEMQASFVSLFEATLKLVVFRTSDALDVALKPLLNDFKEMRTLTQLGERHLAFPKAANIGNLLAMGGVAEGYDELAVLDSGVFWTRVSDLFLLMRDPPRTDATIDTKVAWRKMLSNKLCQACAVQEETGK